MLQFFRCGLVMGGCARGMPMKVPIRRHCMKSTKTMNPTSSYWQNNTMFQCCDHNKGFSSVIMIPVFLLSIVCMHFGIVFAFPPLRATRCCDNLHLFPRFAKIMEQPFPETSVLACRRMTSPIKMIPMNFRTSGGEPIVPAFYAVNELPSFSREHVVSLVSHWYPILPVVKLNP